MSMEWETREVDVYRWTALAGADTPTESRGIPAIRSESKKGNIDIQESRCPRLPAGSKTLSEYR